MVGIKTKNNGRRRPPRRRIGALGGKLPSHPGRHCFQIIAADHRYSRNEASDTEILDLSLEITSGEDAGVRLKVFIALTEMGEEDLMDLLRAVGEYDENAEFDPGMLAGKTFEALLDREDKFYSLSDIQSL